MLANDAMSSALSSGLTIQTSYHGNPLVKLAESGWDAIQINNPIIDTLEPYFEDNEFLKEKAIDSPSAEAAKIVIGQDMKTEQ